ncbi:MAG: diadenylate cyclase CdaA [Oscillospiraceae bacterium]|jgi:diadenylate cyclase
MNLWNVLKNAFYNLANTFVWQDAIDILLLTLIVYEIIKLVRKTRAKQLIIGLGIFVLAYLLARLLGLRAISYLFSNLFQVGVLVIVIMFQPELRKGLEKVGSTGFSRLFSSSGGAHTSSWQFAISAICDACEHMSASRTGALIVIQRRVGLADIANSGTIIDAEVSANLLETIFYEGCPLHDGAVIINDARIEAAGCVLPLTNRTDISRDMGTRHRAGIGMSENSDAIVVIVSEETGIISLANNGMIVRRLDRANLYMLLENDLIPEPSEKQKVKPWLKKLFGKKEEGQDNGSGK